MIKVEINHPNLNMIEFSCIAHLVYPEEHKQPQPASASTATKQPPETRMATTGSTSLHIKDHQSSIASSNNDDDGNGKWSPHRRCPCTIHHHDRLPPFTTSDFLSLYAECRYKTRCAQFQPLSSVWLACFRLLVIIESHLRQYATCGWQ